LRIDVVIVAICALADLRTRAGFDFLFLLLVLLARDLIHCLDRAGLNNSIRSYPSTLTVSVTVGDVTGFHRPSNEDFCWSPRGSNVTARSNIDADSLSDTTKESASPSPPSTAPTLGVPFSLIATTCHGNSDIQRQHPQRSRRQLDASVLKLLQ
jgi:hypothetical protein